MHEAGLGLALVDGHLQRSEGKRLVVAYVYDLDPNQRDYVQMTRRACGCGSY